MIQQHHILHGYQGYCFKDGNFTRSEPISVFNNIVAQNVDSNQSLVLSNSSDYVVGPMPNGCCFCCYYPIVPIGKLTL